MLEIIRASGWPIWPLLLASVLTVALVIERSIVLRRAKVVPPDLLEKVLNDLRRSGPSLEMVKRLEANSPLGRVLAAGLRSMNRSREGMKEAIEECGRSVTHDLERFLTTLGTIAAISPLMGLFGTVVGMIEMFAAQGSQGANPEQLARGISIALNNTGLGLLIAIPATIFWRHFRALVTGFVIDMEQQAVLLVEAIHGDRN